jgi:DNA-3-methyladenine glycosylase I
LAFDDFDYQKIASYDETKYEALLLDAGIIRNKLKIRATIGNAQAFIKLQKEHGSFSNYFWQYTDHKPLECMRLNLKEVPATTSLSDRISKDLKKKGFNFVGSTVVYAYMQAVGMVNDHVEDCFRNKEMMM